MSNGEENNAIGANDFIDIVFDGPPSHESGRFVETEDGEGRSIHAGEWIDRKNGLWALRIARSKTDSQLSDARAEIVSEVTAIADKVWTAIGERAEAQFQLSIANATIERLRGESCEHCGCALLPHRKEPDLCESCLGVCSDDCDHRLEEGDPDVCGKVRKVTLELHADDSLSCTFQTCRVSWDEMMSAVVRFRDKLNWEIQNASKCPMHAEAAVPK